jgi:hypothetical protein
MTISRRCALTSAMWSHYYLGSGPPVYVGPYSLAETAKCKTAYFLPYFATKLDCSYISKCTSVIISIIMSSTNGE